MTFRDNGQRAISSESTFNSSERFGSCLWETELCRSLVKLSSEPPSKFVAAEIGDGSDNENAVLLFGVGANVLGKPSFIVIMQIGF